MKFSDLAPPKWVVYRFFVTHLIVGFKISKILKLRFPIFFKFYLKFFEPRHLKFLMSHFRKMLKEKNSWTWDNYYVSFGIIWGTLFIFCNFWDFFILYKISNVGARKLCPFWPSFVRISENITPFASFRFSLNIFEYLFF